MIKSLKGRTALITGSSKRIGRALALALAGEGVNVILHYSTSEGEAEKLRLELAGLNGAPGRVTAWTLKGDFTLASEYATLIPRALELAKGLDILINNASLFTPVKAADMTFQDLARDVEVNAWVPFALTREFARFAGGSVINLLDTRVAAGYDPEHASYVLSKRLLADLTRTCAREFAPALRVNAIAPGLILPPAGKDLAYFQSLAHNVPLNRHGEPADIAAAALFLLKSDFVTGQTIFVDGGSHLGR